MIHATWKRTILGAYVLLTLVVAAGGGLWVAFIGEAKERREGFRASDRALAALSLSNCTDIRRQTDELFGLLQVLQALVEAMKEDGVLPPDTRVRLEEPAAKRCPAGAVVPEE